MLLLYFMAKQTLLKKICKLLNLDCIITTWQIALRIAVRYICSVLIEWNAIKYQFTKRLVLYSMAKELSITVKIIVSYSTSTIRRAIVIQVITKITAKYLSAPYYNKVQNICKRTLKCFYWILWQIKQL